MNIRSITPSDYHKLKELHKKFYDKEFNFDELLNNYLSSFVVTSDNGEIITGGGVRVIAESVIITDKEYLIKDRREALQEMLRACMFTANIRGFNQLHAFIQDEKWLKHLKRVGFKDTVGKSIVLNI